MPKKKYTGLIAGGIIVLLGIYLVVTYNSLVKKEEAVKKQWSEVQATYQRRLNLVPNLVAVVKGMSEFEAGTLEAVASARSRALAGQSTVFSSENVQQEQMLQDSLAFAANRLIAVIENYPVLKGTDAYAGLQTQLEGTERRIKIARKDFNQAVADYNVTVRSTSGMLAAKLFGFKPMEGFQAEEGADRAVEIKF